MDLSKESKHGTKPRTKSTAPRKPREPRPGSKEARRRDFVREEVRTKTAEFEALCRMRREAVAAAKDEPGSFNHLESDILEWLNNKSNSDDATGIAKQWIEDSRYAHRSLAVGYFLDMDYVPTERWVDAANRVLKYWIKTFTLPHKELSEKNDN